MNVSEKHDGVPQRGQILAVVPRGTTEQLRVVADSFNGTAFLSLRIWWLSPDRAWMPSRRGLTIRKAELHPVMKAMELACFRLGVVEHEESGGPAGVVDRGSQSLDK